MSDIIATFYSNKVLCIYFRLRNAYSTTFSYLSINPIPEDQIPIKCPQKKFRLAGEITLGSEFLAKEIKVFFKVMQFFYDCTDISRVLIYLLLIQ